MKVAVVGATGMVGGVMLKVLEERGFPISELIPVASERSAGKELTFAGKKYRIVTADKAIEMKPDLALFSAGGAASLEWAPKFAEAGTYVVDNSSAWRMSNDHKLIIPEINAYELEKEDRIIANPNCSTIQLLMVLAPLHRKYKVKRAVISTYQSITGTGVNAVRQMENERQEKQGEKAYPYNIDKNCLPHCDEFGDNGYTKEEMKLVNETVKILGDESVKVTATAVRVPVVGGHSESVNIEFENDFELGLIRKLLHNTPGVVVQDNPLTNTYPMPKYCADKDDVFVGRIRRDETREKTLNLWIVADNLRKGAATNTVQIAEYLVQKGILKTDGVTA